MKLLICLLVALCFAGAHAQEPHHMTKVLDGIYAAHAKADVEGALAFFDHPNFVLDNTHPPTPRTSPLYGVWQGKDGFRQWLSIIGKRYQVNSFSHKLVSVDDKGALVHALVDETCRSTGKRVAQPANVYHRFHFDGDKISRIDVYHPDAAELAAICRSDAEEWLGTGLASLVAGESTAVSPNATVVVKGPSDSPLLGQHDAQTFFSALAASDYHEPTFELLSSDDLKVLVEVNYSKWSIKSVDSGKKVWRNLKAFVIYQLEKVEVPATTQPVETVDPAQHQANDSAIEVQADPQQQPEVVVVAADAEAQPAQTETAQAVAVEPQHTYQVSSVDWMWVSGELTTYAPKKNKQGKEQHQHQHADKEKEKANEEETNESGQEGAAEEGTSEQEVKETKAGKKVKEGKEGKEAKKEKSGKKEKAQKKDEV